MIAPAELTVKPLKVEALLAKLTVLPVLDATRATVETLALFVDEILSTVIEPLFESPRVRVPVVVILCSSAPLRDKPPVVSPRPMVPPSEVRILIFPEPPAMALVVFKTRSFAVMDKALLPVVSVMPEASVKSPVPSSSESASKVAVVPVPVRLESALNVIPLAEDIDKAPSLIVKPPLTAMAPFALAVRILKLEELANVIALPDLLAFNVVVPEIPVLLVLEILSTVIEPLLASPRVKPVAVIFCNSLPVSV